MGHKCALHLCVSISVEWLFEPSGFECAIVLRRNMDAPAHLQTKRIAEYFGEPDGRANFDRLVRISEKWIARWQASSRASAQDPEHYVNEAVQRCLPDGDGVCQRVIKSDVPLPVALQGVIKSIISHDLFPSGVRQKTRAGLGWMEPSNGERREKTADDYHEPMWRDAESSPVGENMDGIEILGQFLEFVRRDNLVFRMVKLAVEDGIDGPAEVLAQKLGIKISDVYVARKRHLRLCAAFKKEVTK